ncbi:MAG: DnaJ domain-containing protein [Nitrospirales bacterium]|nr:DnaJ domain-containing protein [Nitrospirales bacterium]
MVHLDYYVTLGVSPEASDEEIKKSYRRLVFQHHPDRNHDNKDAQAKIREINAAYEVLGDPETRKSYERLRFGGYGKSSPDYGDIQDEAVDLSLILWKMEKTLWDEARRELFSVLIQDSAKIKQELGVIRKLTVSHQGYDTFLEDMVKKRGMEILPDLVTAEMEERRDRLLNVALQMMVSQGITRAGNQDDETGIQMQLRNAYDRGRIDGYCEACELFYARR